MRKLIAAAFVSLDGVMQAPGGPEEDPAGDFPYGGWVWPYMDETVPHGTAEAYGRPYELVLGRRTYDIFASYWPHVDAGGENGAIARTFNEVPKHVASRTRPALGWRNSRWLGEDAVGAVRALKGEDGPDLLTQGSSDFLQSLLAADLVDELRLLTYPVVLGAGKRLFGAGTRPGAFTLTRFLTSPTGVVVAHYERAGDVQASAFPG